MLSRSRRWRRGKDRNPEIAARVERVRRSRGGPWWSRPFGALWIGLAVLLALDPDYPVASGQPSGLSAKTGSYLLPRPLQPRGPVRARQPRFAWEWAGPPVRWDLVLLDEALDEVARIEGIEGLEYVAGPDLQETIAAGGTFVWFVEGELHGRRFRSVPEEAVFRP